MQDIFSALLILLPLGSMDFFKVLIPCACKILKILSGQGRVLGTVYFYLNAKLHKGHLLKPRYGWDENTCF